MQLATIAGYASLPVLWWIFWFSSSAGQTPISAWSGFLLGLPILFVATLTKRGLLDDFWRWQTWGRELAVLYLTIPVQRRRWLRSVREDIVPHVREWINKHRTPSFNKVLNLRDVRGLRRPAAHGPIVRTASIIRCAREINRLVPGAVGIAGQRGAGKTTVIDRAVSNEFTDPAHRPFLAVVVSAPVRFDAREFVLHLHATTCRTVISHLSRSSYSTSTETERQWARYFRAERRKSLVASMIGRMLVVALLLGVSWAWNYSKTPEHRDPFTLVRRLLVDPGGLLHSGEWPDVLGQAAGALLLLAVAMTLVVRLVYPIARVIGGATLRLLRWAGSRPPASHAALRRLAEQQLDRIRFLQTHTDSWLGKLSSPAGADLSRTRTLQRAEQPLTYSEAIDRLRDFLSKVVHVLVPAQISGVIMGIDEVDKISDPDEAQTFLNEIKGIFGVQSCLFLVSVSDDALTAFDRRGVFNRDTMDSTFTTMIHVAPFTLSDSRSWLAQRAIGIPEPFVCLCHCLSGGLPRELARTATILHDLYIERGKEDLRLPSVTQAMVAMDLTAKVRAWTHTAAQLQPDNDGSGDPTDLLGLLETVATTIDSEHLSTLSRTVWPAMTTAPTTALHRLQVEVASYLYFYAALLEVFADDLSEHDLAQASDDTSAQSLMELLCHARQRLGVNAQIGWNLLVLFRQRWTSARSLNPPMPPTTESSSLTQ